MVGVKEKSGFVIVFMMILNNLKNQDSTMAHQSVLLNRNLFLSALKKLTKKNGQSSN